MCWGGRAAMFFVWRIKDELLELPISKIAISNSISNIRLGISQTDIDFGLCRQGTGFAIQDFQPLHVR
jgi:hypothetical protein